MLKGLNLSFLGTRSRKIGLALIIAGIAGLLVYPRFGDPSIVNILVFAFAYAVFAASWDIEAGYCGQINIGPVFTFGISAFVTAWLILHLGFPDWLSLFRRSRGGNCRGVCLGGSQPETLWRLFCNVNLRHRDNCAECGSHLRWRRRI